MESIRLKYEDLWDRVCRAISPTSDDFRTKDKALGQQNQRQYDSFPMQAMDKFAAAIEGGLIPRTEMWTELSTGDNDLDEDHDVKLYLEDKNQLLWDERYSPRANFSSSAHEKILSLGSFGNGCFLVEARKGGGIFYKSIHISEIFIQKNREGFIDKVHRKFCLSTHDAIELFGPQTPERILKSKDAGRMSEKFEFLNCIMPQSDRDDMAIGMKSMPFVGHYVFLADKLLIRTDGYYEMPYIPSRYLVNSDEVYGQGPATKMLADISMLQEMRRTTIEAANISVDPPVLLHADDISDFDQMPGAHNYGALDDQGRPMAMAWNTGVNVGLGLDMISDVRRQIDDGFMGVYFRVLVENPQMTATQAMLIAQQQGQMTAPPIGRLQSEWLGPMIRRESGILYRQGKYGDMPDVLRQHFESTGKSLQIKYTSPLTRAARTGEAVGILRTFESLAPIAQIDPTVYDAFDAKEVARIVADANGVPARALKSPEDMKAQQEAEEQQAALGDVLTAAPIAAQTAKTLSEAQAMSRNNPVLN